MGRRPVILAIGVLVLGLVSICITSRRDDVEMSTLVMLGVGFALAWRGERYVITHLHGDPVVLHCVTYINQAGDFLKKVCTP